MRALTKVGENVRARVDAVGLNRQQFATALGITWGNADGIYRGRQCPSVLTLARIGGVVGCKPAELLEGVEAVPPAADPAELLKAAKGGNGRRGRKASGAEAEKPKATKSKARKTTKRTARKGKAAKSAKAGR